MSSQFQHHYVALRRCKYVSGRIEDAELSIAEISMIGMMSKAVLVL